jgi:hypothetical protein
VGILAAAEGCFFKSIGGRMYPGKKINPPKKPNAKTCKAMADARKGKTSKAKNLSDIYVQLGI